jgi:hypothetical protein
MPQHVSPYEQTEIKNMLGESLVDQTLELHGEVRNKKNDRTTMKKIACRLFYLQQ